MKEMALLCGIRGMRNLRKENKGADPIVVAQAAHPLHRVLRLVVIHHLKVRVHQAMEMKL